jgi:stage III sporulation protein AB
MHLMKLFGAVMVFLGCGGIGFSLVASYRHQQRCLQQMIQALEYMECELQYRMPPLPELCIGASQVCTGCVSSILLQLSKELEAQITPNAAACIRAVFAKRDDLPDTLRKCFSLLEDSLGRFDLVGQLQGLNSVKKYVGFELEKLYRNQDVRLRSYQTLGFCAGAALVVLFL